MKRYTNKFAPILLLFTLLTSQNILAQDTFYFSKVISAVNTDSPRGSGLRPSKVTADKKGGVLEARVTNTAGTCYEDVQFEWRFLEDISTISQGIKNKFHITGRRLGGTCVDQKNTHYVIPSSSNSLSGDFLKKNGLKGAYNSITTVTEGTQNVYATAWNSGIKTSAYGTFTLNSTSGIDQTYFDLQFQLATWPYGSANYKSVNFHVVYVFTKEASTESPTGSLNCGALYGMGVNVGIIEYGTLVNVEPSFLIGFFDNAITGAKASGCLSSTDISDLSELKDRMLTLGNSKSIASSISNYRQVIARKVASCSCK